MLGIALAVLGVIAFACVSGRASRSPVSIYADWRHHAGSARRD